jgi:2-keto-3-deoxy-6-phosphogluconate aldolase
MASRRQKQEVLAALRDGGIVPVIRADSADTALRIVDALVAGGIRTLEITMTVPTRSARSRQWRTGSDRACCSAPAP